MTWFINRVTSAVTVNRTTPKVVVEGGAIYQITRAASGPRGQPAGQDVGWMLSVALGAGEALNGPPLPHAATYTTIYAHTDSGVAEAQTFTILQKRANAVIAAATFVLNPGDHDIETMIAGGGLAFAVGDVPGLVLPNPADTHITDLSVALGSTP